MQILIAGFDPATNKQLVEKLERIGQNSRTISVDSLSATDTYQAGAVIASAEDIQCTRWLKRLRDSKSSLPFILMGRVGDDAKWIAALEAGATDYCAADVDCGNLAWMLDNAIGRSYFTSAA